MRQFSRTRIYELFHMGDAGTVCSWWILNFLQFSFWFRLTFLAYECFCTVRVCHVFLVVHIHSLALTVVLQKMHYNAAQFYVLCLFAS